MARLKSYAVLVGKTITTLLLSDKDAARRRPAIEAAEKILAGQDRESATPAVPPVPDRVPEGGAVVITPADAAVGATTADEATPAPPTPPTSLPAAPEAPAAAADATPAADATAATAGEASADDPEALTPEQIEAQLEAEAAGAQAKAATPPANKARGSRSKA